MGYIIGNGALILGIIGIISLVFLVLGLIMFGKLIKHQSKIWLMAKKGYTQIRHIREDMNENYFFLRIRNDHFSFDDGIYMEQKDVKTKVKTILAPLDYNLLKKKEEASLTAEDKQILRFLKSIEDSKVMDITTLSWGIPTITYYGNNPNPVNVKDIKKVYDSKNIAAMIKRIIMTKEWKLVKLVLILCAIALVLWVILGFLDYGLMNKSTTNLGNCLSQLNTTSIKYQELLNTSRVYNVVQNSTILI
jgi:hypothetical protein